MTDFELSGLISADVSDFVEGTEEASDAAAELGDEAEETSDSLLDFDAAGAAAGGALAGIGTAAQGALDETREMREELNRAGQAAGMSQNEMVDLATSLSDGTLDTEDAAGALGALAEQGVDTEEGLAELTGTADDIADATGESASVIARDLGPAMAAVGDDIEDMDDVADGVVSTVNETNLEFTDFTRTVERSRDELNEMGLSTDETAALMGDFAEETGLSGRELRREFSSELEDADGDLQAFADSTGINIDSQADLQDALRDSEGATDEYAKSVSDNTSLMDDLRVGFQDVTLQAGDMLGPISAAAPAMQAAGVAAIALSTVNTGALIPSLIGVATAAAPVAVPLAALVAVGGALAFLFRDELGAALSFVSDLLFEDLLPAVQEFVEDGLEFVMDELEPVIEEFQLTASVLAETLLPPIEMVAEFLAETFGPSWEATGGLVSDVAEHIADVVAFQFRAVTDMLQVFARLLRGDFAGAWEIYEDLVSDAVDGVRRVVVGMIDDVIDVLRRGGERINDAAGDAASAIVSPFESAYDFIIGNSLIPDLTSDAAAHFRGRGAQELGEGASVAGNAIREGMTNQMAAMDNEMRQMMAGTVDAVNEGVSEISSSLDDGRDEVGDFDDEVGDRDFGGGGDGGDRDFGDDDDDGPPEGAKDPRDSGAGAGPPVEGVDPIDIGLDFADGVADGAFASEVGRTITDDSRRTDPEVTARNRLSRLLGTIAAWSEELADLDHQHIDSAAFGSVDTDDPAALLDALELFRWSGAGGDGAVRSLPLLEDLGFWSDFQGAIGMPGPTPRGPSSMMPAIQDLATIAGGDDLLGLATGGHIRSGGLARLHDGETVVPEAQVDSRGDLDLGETNDRLDDVVDHLRRLRDAVESADGRVRDRDVVHALQRLFDRQGASL